MAWSNWENVTVKVNNVIKPIQGTPAVVAWQKGLLHVFVRGKSPDRSIYHGVYNGLASTPTWSWEVMPVPLPASELKSISAAAWGDNRIDLFAAGTDKRIYHAAWNGPYKWDKGWVLEPEGGATEFTPSTVSGKLNRFDVFVHTTDHLMSNLYWEGNWSPEWRNIGGYGKKLNSAPAAAASGQNQVDVFALEATDRKHLIHTVFDGNSHDWSLPGGTTDETYEIAGDPFAVSSALGDGRVDVFARSTTNRLIHREFANGNWTTKWEDLGSPGANFNIIGEPAAVAWWDGGWKRFDCFAVGENNVLKHTWWV